MSDLTTSKIEDLKKKNIKTNRKKKRPLKPSIEILKKVKEIDAMLERKMK